MKILAFDNKLPGSRKIQPIRQHGNTRIFEERFICELDLCADNNEVILRASGIEDSSIGQGRIDLL